MSHATTAPTTSHTGAEMSLGAGPLKNSISFGPSTATSDSTAIAEALFLPYWFWGTVTAVFSFAVLVLGIYLAFRQQPKEK